MTISWSHINDSIFFEVQAPTSGWVTIGFNDKDQITGAYFFMGHVVDQKAQIEEHYTLNHGNYRPVKSLGYEISVNNTSGYEDEHGTVIHFSTKKSPQNNYQKDLNKGKKLFMIVAYSQEDDFQHHSIMRTSLEINL